MKNIHRDNYTNLVLYIQEVYSADVELVDFTNKRIKGQIDYDTRLIQINKNMSFRFAYMILAHELGHLVSRNKLQKINFEDEYTTDEREDLAFKYGWYFCQKYSCNLITKKDWIYLHGK